MYNFQFGVVKNKPHINQNIVCFCVARVKVHFIPIKWVLLWKVLPYTPAPLTVLAVGCTCCYYVICIQIHSVGNYFQFIFIWSHTKMSIMLTSGVSKKTQIVSELDYWRRPTTETCHLPAMCKNKLKQIRHPISFYKRLINFLTTKSFIDITSVESI